MTNNIVDYYAGLLSAIAGLFCLVVCIMTCIKSAIKSQESERYNWGKKATRAQSFGIGAFIFLTIACMLLFSGKDDDPTKPEAITLKSTWAGSEP